MKLEVDTLLVEFDEASFTLRISGDALSSAHSVHDQWTSFMMACGFPGVSRMTLDVRDLGIIGSLAAGVFYWMACRVAENQDATLHVRGRASSSWQERVLPVMSRICGRVNVEFR